MRKRAPKQHWIVCADCGRLFKLSDEPDKRACELIHRACKMDREIWRIRLLAGRVLSGATPRATGPGETRWM